MAELSALERYNQNIPLTPELDDIAHGRDEEAEVQPAALENAPTVDVEEELTAEEKRHLKELRGGRGWPVLLRVLEKTSLRLRRGAISCSASDPLGRNPATGDAWMMDTVFRQMKQNLPAVIDAELKEKVEVEQ